MATKISISKKLETAIRAEVGGPGWSNILTEVLGLLDAAQTKVGGLPSQVFLQELMRFRSVALPTHNGAGRTYAQLAKRLRDYGVTREQAAALGLWLKAQAWLRDDQLTVEKIIVALPEFLTRALKDRPKFKRTEWDEGGV